jgi:hypothetical protein
MNVRKKLRRPEKKRIIVNNGKPLCGGDLSDQRIDLPHHPLSGTWTERWRKRLGKGGDGGEEDTCRLTPAVGELPKKADDCFQVATEVFSRRLIAVHPDIVRAQLDEDEARVLAGHGRSLLSQKAKVFARGIALPAVVENLGPPPFPAEEALEMTRVLGIRQAVSGTEDDDSPGGPAASRADEDDGQETEYRNKRVPQSLHQ